MKRIFMLIAAFAPAANSLFIVAPIPPPSSSLCTSKGIANPSTMCLPRWPTHVTAHSSTSSSYASRSKGYRHSYSYYCCNRASLRRRNDVGGGSGSMLMKAAIPPPIAANVVKPLAIGSSTLGKTISIALKPLLASLPPPVASLIALTVESPDLLLLAVFYILARKGLRQIHKAQQYIWRWSFKKEVPPFESSVVGFLQPRCQEMVGILAIVTAIKACFSVLVWCGWSLQQEVVEVIIGLLYTIYAGYFFTAGKQFFLPIWLPEVKQDKRRGFIYQRSTSAISWLVTFLAVMERISSFVGVPITSTLAFGGIGGLALGLASKDVISNLFGGLMLLLTEPFTPGDMVTFYCNGAWYEGRVERVGWYQTRIRGKDTRPTYVPNQVFSTSMVTNMDRITHRKFESTFTLRYRDAPKVPDIVSSIKDGLRSLPKLDLLSPFRVHLTDVTETGLKITVFCYFATKSLDEYLTSQQMALLEVSKAVEKEDAELAYPMYMVDMPSKKIGQSIVEGIFETAASPQSPPPAPVVLRHALPGSVARADNRPDSQPTRPHGRQADRAKGGSDRGNAGGGGGGGGTVANGVNNEVASAAAAAASAAGATKIDTGMGPAGTENWQDLLRSAPRPPPPPASPPSSSTSPSPPSPSPPSPTTPPQPPPPPLSSSSTTSSSPPKRAKMWAS